jgi:hypothetical protein
VRSENFMMELNKRVEWMLNMLVSCVGIELEHSWRQCFQFIFTPSYFPKNHGGNEVLGSSWQSGIFCGVTIGPFDQMPGFPILEYVENKARLSLQYIIHFNRFVKLHRNNLWFSPYNVSVMTHR